VSGRARKKTLWIENGVVENLSALRFWAEKTGVESLPFPEHDHGRRQC
jgi:hypothetical protein